MLYNVTTIFLGGLPCHNLPYDLLRISENGDLLALVSTNGQSLLTTADERGRNAGSASVNVIAIEGVII